MATPKIPDTPTKNSVEHCPPEQKLVCGVVRPISAIGDYLASHWADVADILEEAIENSGLEARLVSEASSTGIIHARIVKNLYQDPVVVCDISGKNPNVMLELGMRLAFDKPVIVIKDDETDYSFDTSPIEHITYPRSLHYASILQFKEDLSAKILATLKPDSDTKSFLQQFGPFKVAQIEQENVPGYEILRDELSEIKRYIAGLSEAQKQAEVRPPAARNDRVIGPGSLMYKIDGLDDSKIEKLNAEILMLNNVNSTRILKMSNAPYIRVTLDDNSSDDRTKSKLQISRIFRKLREGE